MRLLLLFILFLLTGIGCLTNSKKLDKDNVGSTDVEQDIRIRYSDSWSAPGSEFTQITITAKANGECTYQKSTGQAARRDVYGGPAVQFESKALAKSCREYVRQFQRHDEGVASRSHKVGGRTKHIWVTCGERNYQTSTDDDGTPKGYRQFMTLNEQAVREFNPPSSPSPSSR